MQTLLSEKHQAFYNFHKQQLQEGGFPAQLVSILADKLEKQTFDFGEYFQIQDNQNDDTFQVIASADIQKDSNVFLIDHQLTFKSDELRNILEKDQELVQTLKYHLQYFDEKKNIPGLEQPVQKYKGVEEYDSLEIVDPSTYKIPKTTLSVSFFDNQIKSLELVKIMIKELPNLKCLFLNYNPVCDEPNFKETIENEFPQIEILNSKLTSNSGEFGIKFCSYKYNLDKTNKIKTEMIKQLDLSNRAVLNMKSFEIFRKFLNLVQLDIRKNDFDTEDKFQKLLQILKCCTKLTSLVIDFEYEQKLWDLKEEGKLIEICPTLEKVNERFLSYNKPLQNEEDIKFVTKNIWKCLGNYYKLGKCEAGEAPTWFLNQLQGIAIQHSDTPNLRMIPFQYSLSNSDQNGLELKSLTIIWPIYQIQAGDIVYRDYLAGFDESKQRSARLATWFKVPEDYFAKCIQDYKNKLMHQTLMGKNQIKQFKNQEGQTVGKVPSQRPLKVVTDYQLVKDHLTLKEFEIIEDEQKADVAFLVFNFQNRLKDLMYTHLCNQFPYEQCIIHKAHLAQTVYSTIGQVDWLQQTFNLEYQLSEFIGEYQRRQNTLEDNIWIIKAFDLARSMDMIVTDNLDQIIRQTETLPRLAQKYIQNPLTIQKKKIDLRFMVAVRSIKPLEVYIYKNFVIRSSNNDFTNDYRSRENYETHFTVMNYGGKKMNEILQEEFIKIFENENPSIKWNDVSNKIKNMVKELFIAVATKYPKMHCEKSRSVYGMDVMIENGSYQPKLLEMTFSPDSNRICKYYPSYYNDLFSLLYLNQNNVQSFESVI
ncbi:hypothetical protein ABPG74_020012 [Tetrahymena malaccensis]